MPDNCILSSYDIAVRIVLQFHMILNDIINLTYDIQIITESKIVQNTSYIADAETKGFDLFSIFFLQKYLKEVCLISRQKGNSDQWSTISTNWNTERLLEQQSTNLSKLKFVVDKTYQIRMTSYFLFCQQILATFEKVRLFFIKILISLFSAALL